jgi:hypothetical protein
MWQAENIIGLKAAAEKIRAYEKVHGPHWAIAPLLDRLAASGGKLADAGAAAGSA